MRLLLATDGSPDALAAARFVAELPLGADDTLALLAVQPSPRPGDDAPNGMAAAWVSEALSAARQAVSHTTAQLDAATRNGDPTEEILRAAAEHPTDLIVLGSHGHSAVRRFLVGSVSEKLVRHADCSVLVVR